jgi:organic hydroperoxide reductase OsmC/OhrA
MSEHVATVEWRSSGGFADGTYSRAHALRFDGGTVVPGSSSPQVVPVPFSDPVGVDPEEALVASAASCHMLWFLHMARDSGYEVAAYRDEASGRTGRGADGRIMVTRITLRPRIDFAGQAPDAEALARLHHEAHERCFIANSLKGEVVVES